MFFLVPITYAKRIVLILFCTIISFVKAILMSCCTNIFGILYYHRPGTDSLFHSHLLPQGQWLEINFSFCFHIVLFFVYSIL